MALGTACPADAVDVVLVLLRHVVVEHGVHVVHVDAAAGHVGGHEHPELAVPELLHDGLALALGDVAVDALGVHTPHLQELGEPLGVALGVAEADDPVIALMLQDPGDGVHLAVGGYLDAVLQDVRLVLLGGLDGDLLGITLIDPGDVHHLTGDGGGEHAQILAAGDLVQDAGHIVDEAHVQHPVGLVQHHGPDGLQHHGAALHMVAEAAGRGHHDLGLALQGVDLLADGLSAVQAHQPHALVIHGDVPHFVGDLHGQLTGGGHDDGLHLFAVRVDLFNDGDTEGHGLAGAGGRLGNDVLARHHGRDAAGLHRRGNSVSLVADGPQRGLGQAEALKCHPLGDLHSVFPRFSQKFQSHLLYHSCQVGRWKNPDAALTNV